MQTRKVFTAYDAIYTTEILRFSINIECAIIESGMFDDDESLTLFHGTTRKHVPSIMANGLEPQLGDFTKHFYDIDDEDDDVEPLSELVFAADLAGLQRCVSAIGFQIMAETGNRDYSAEGMRTYGALCIFEVGKNDLEHRADDQDDMHPHHVEPGDYYSYYRVQVDKVMSWLLSSTQTA